MDGDLTRRSVSSTAAPLVSVIMPVYNAERHLRDAVHSILRQTLTDFEFIIVDDGSNDNSDAVIRSCPDKRIRFLKNEKNFGISATLNRGILAAKGKYIARMDADDISMSHRLETQYKFMEENSEYGAVGTLAEYITEEDEAVLTSVLPETDEEIRLRLPAFFFHHGSVMMRREILLAVEMYDEWCRKTEDLLLWNKIAKVSKLYVIQKPLYKWRLTVAGGTNVVRTNDEREFFGQLKNSRDLDELTEQIKKHDQHAEVDQKAAPNSNERYYQYCMTISKLSARNNRKRLALKYMKRALSAKFVLKDAVKLGARVILPASWLNSLGAR